MAFSRVTDIDKLDLLLPNRDDGRIKNIVYLETGLAEIHAIPV